MYDYAEKILESPDAPQQLEYIQNALADERRRRTEFYNWITEDISAEFINGEVIIHSPVKKRHWDASDLLSRLLSVFASIKKLGRVATEKAMISLTRNDYEPDICFFSAEQVATFEEDQVLFPAPDFVVEILSQKTAKYDRGVKREDYATHGIREYWIIDPARRQIEQYLLPTEEAREYFPARIYHLDDDIESRVIKGFSIPVRAVFEEAANLEALKTLI
ncbi:MAG: Uma2 family endonuclease [Saprospiraceae bacterium]